MKLFIAEKPSLAQAIAASIGVGKKSDGYISLNDGKEIVTWCYGHILVQLNPDEYAEKYRAWRMENLPIIPIQWKLKVKPEAAKQFKIIRELIGKAAEIIHAGDPDREGQLLVDEVLDFVGNKKPVQRILLNALDEKSIKQSLKDLRDNDDFEGMKNAALGRSRADWLIGMNLSRAYTIRTRQVGYEGVSIGRVMTPTMALVVCREEEISKFKPITHYALKANFANNFGEIPATWQMSDKVASLDSEGRLLDKKVAENFLTRLNSLVGTQGKIIRIEEKKKRENQRLPYSLSTLQIEAGKRYGYSPQTVLDAIQMLYEKKLTTYPRSDCEYLPENQFADSKEILGHLKDLPNFNKLVKNADTSIYSRAWNDKKISAHHAIIPTRIKADFEKLNVVEQNLYEMVSQAYLAQFYPEHEYKATTVIISFADNYPECKTTARENKGKPDFTSLARKTTQCPKCKGTMTQYKSKFNSEMYWHCTNKDCDLVLSDHSNKPVAVPCPSCQTGYFVKRMGKKGVFWSCSNYPQCNETRKDNNGVPTL